VWLNLPLRPCNLPCFLSSLVSSPLPLLEFQTLYGNPIFLCQSPSPLFEITDCPDAFCARSKSFPEPFSRAIQRRARLDRCARTAYRPRAPFASFSHLWALCQVSMLIPLTLRRVDLRLLLSSFSPKVPGFTQFMIRRNCYAGMRPPASGARATRLLLFFLLPPEFFFPPFRALPSKPRHPFLDLAPSGPRERRQLATPDCYLESDCLLFTFRPRKQSPC